MSLQSDVLVALVRGRLLQDFRLAGQAIDVICCDGDVSLVGVVGAPELKELAVELISGLIGVRWVRDELIVRHVRKSG
ncbi:MAG: BON domain-containing protein [Armatimonadota bacterium]